jgi:hypothetical protein
MNNQQMTTPQNTVPLQPHGTQKNTPTPTTRSTQPISKPSQDNHITSYLPDTIHNHPRPTAVALTPNTKHHPTDSSPDTQTPLSNKTTPTPHHRNHFSQQNIAAHDENLPVGDNINNTKPDNTL